MEDATTMWMMIGGAALAMWYISRSGTEGLVIPNTAVPARGGEGYLDQTSAVDIRDTPLQLFSELKFQGAQFAAKRDQDVPFLVHTVGADGAVVREWRFKSMQFGPRATLRICANFQKNTRTGERGRRNVVKATPRFSSIDDIQAYLEEDAQLKNENTLFWEKNQALASIVYTIAVV
jgi:hypothetical protein